MVVGGKIKRHGEVYVIYKINEKGCYAEDEFGLNIVFYPSYLKRIK
jgi:hypothetical protein